MINISELKKYTLLYIYSLVRTVTPTGYFSLEVPVCACYQETLPTYNTRSGIHYCYQFDYNPRIRTININQDSSYVDNCCAKSLIARTQYK